MSLTLPNGAKPMPSSRELSPKLMKNCVVLEFGPEVAKVTVPRVLLALTGSSSMRLARHSALSAGSPLMPACAMKPLITRKNATSVK